MPIARASRAKNGVRSRLNRPGAGYDDSLN